MKILITTDLYKPSVNGVVTSVLNLKKGLEAKGHEVRILTLSPDHHSFIEDNVYYIGSVDTGKIYPGTHFRLHYPHSFKSELIEWDPDIVHSQCEFSTFPIARQIARKCNAPLIHTYHTVYEDYTHYFCPIKSLGRYLVSRFTRHILKYTDSVIAPSQKVASLLSIYNVNTPVSVIPTGIDLKTFSGTDPQVYASTNLHTFTDTDPQLFAGTDDNRGCTSKSNFKTMPATDGIQSPAANTFGIPGINRNSLKLIFIGRLAKEKNIEELLRMTAACSDLPIELIIVGDGPERPALIKLCGQLNIENMVIFTGMVSPDKVSGYYRLGDIFVNASNSETQGLTYIEAMASGLPMLCKKDACLDGIVTDGINGWQYQTPDDFRKHIVEMINDRSLKSRLSDASKAVSKHFSTEYFADSAEVLYIQNIKARTASEQYHLGKGHLGKTAASLQ